MIYYYAAKWILISSIWERNISSMQINISAFLRFPLSNLDISVYNDLPYRKIQSKISYDGAP